MQHLNPETHGWMNEDVELGGWTLPTHPEPSPRRRAAPAHTDTSGLRAELDVRKLEVQPLLKMILCASNQYSMGCSRFNTSKVEGSYNPISCKL